MGTWERPFLSRASRADRMRPERSLSDKCEARRIQDDQEHGVVVHRYVLTFSVSTQQYQAHPCTGNAHNLLLEGFEIDLLRLLFERCDQWAKAVGSMRDTRFKKIGKSCLHSVNKYSFVIHGSHFGREQRGLCGPRAIS